MLKELNSPFMYLVCGGIILFVAIVCVIFLVRSYRAGKAIGMDPKVLKRAITSSATFSVLPAVGILLGVIALSGSLGTPWPWLRLSVIGALHYETQVAEAAAEQVGIGSLSIQNMTPKAFATIALLMSICIMWGMILSFFFNKRYTNRLHRQDTDNAPYEEKNKEIEADMTQAANTAEVTERELLEVNKSKVNSSVERKQADKKSQKNSAGFGDMAMTAMFIGLVSAYIGSYIGEIVSGNGRFTFSGSPVHLIVALISAAVMALFTWLAQKKNMGWLENFSIAGSMLIGMAAAIFL